MSKQKGMSVEQKAELVRRIAHYRSEGGTLLDLMGLSLTELPDAVSQLKRLKRLDIQNNQIHYLPAWLTELRDLEEFHWYNNGPITLPNWLPTIPHLHTLSLGGDQDIENLAVIASLRGLETLALEQMELKAVPESLRNATKLQNLNLAGNSIDSLPDWVSHWKALDYLDLGSNSLSQLPATFAQLTNLRTLNLQRNQLTTLPPALLALTHLDTIGLGGNPLTDIPAELIGTHDAQQILAYARKLQGSGGARPLNEFKLILVGHGGVGKTALVNRLLRDDFAHTDMTRGIQITPWPVRAGGDKVLAHVWDFGGQDIMHGTHQFFLTRRSLYVLVLAARESKQADDAEYWLKTIAGFGGDSPVIVVLNKQEERTCEVNENALRSKYPNIQAFIKTDCKSGRGIAEVLETISREADRLEGLRDQFPAAWFQIKERLSGMQENFLTFERFREECAKLGEPQSKEQDQLAGVLHILGIALNFRDDERLCETSVLNPLWVTGGIYSLLNDNKLAERHGELRREDFSRVLSAEHYPKSTHDFLLRLMGKFELCFPLDAEGRGHLIPELLGEQEPDAAGPLDTTEALAFSYYYPRLLPHGLLARVIVRLYQIISGHLRWRTGAILEWNGAKALIKADADDRCIRLRVRGEDAPRRELLSIIRGEFDELHRQFHGLRPKEVIYLPDYPNVSVDYSHVEAAAREGLRKMPIFTEGNMIMVNPDRLLRQFEVKGEPRDAGDRGAWEVEPEPPPHDAPGTQAEVRP